MKHDSLPNFLIVGAMRSGTTFLSHHLASHPDVFFAPRKEIHFFDFNFEKGIEWYKKQFSGAKGQKVVGEGTQTYMYISEVPARIAAVLPDVKLILILRNPVDRAYSHYWHNRTRSVETLDFREAILNEPGRLGGNPIERARFSYVDRGRYVYQLRRLCDHFPRQALHVILFEDMKKNPLETFKSVSGFLEIDTGFVPSNIDEPVNRAVTFRSLKVRQRTLSMPPLVRNAVGRFNTVDLEYEPMDEAVRAELLKTFSEDNESLQSWLGRDLSLWKA